MCGIHNSEYHIRRHKVVSLLSAVARGSVAIEHIISLSIVQYKHKATSPQLFHIVDISRRCSCRSGHSSPFKQLVSPPIPSHEQTSMHPMR